MGDHQTQQQISDVDYQKLVLDFNARENPDFLGARLDQLFDKIVDEFPHNTALIHNNFEISYKDLDSSANSFARGLQKRGLSHGDAIGLAISRSMDMIALIIAVLKLGAVYVPIDPLLPANRIENMIDNAKLKFLLLDGKPTEGLAPWTKLCLNVHEIRDDGSTDASNLTIRTSIHHKDLAYIIYTSGSTGKPKGVEVSHGAAANFLSSLRHHEPGCSERDRLLAITTVSFDMSVLELLLPILSGAAIVIANSGDIKDPHQILNLMQVHRVTILQATPATWTMLLESGWTGNPRLSKIICGGEPLSRRLADRLLCYADSVWNVYGPAETTYGSVGKVGTDAIDVGRPVVNGRIYVLGDDLSPVSLGCEGEVYIGGGSVSNGYRYQPELTQSRFLQNPFHEGTFFRTGDLARFVDYGKLQVMGRLDGVVKIRGHRIDVGDVETALTDHPDISEAAVIHRDDRLVAYCVARNPSTHRTTSFEAQMRAWVAERLPSWMIPAFFVQLSELPLSPSQKVDRKALPDPLDAIQPSQIHVQPVSDLEKILKGIWSKVLGHNHFGIEESFFDVGGDSVRMTRVQVALQNNLNRFVPIPILFENFTIKSLALYLADPLETHQAKRVGAMNLPRYNHDDDIAIVSTACRLPGGIESAEDFWQVLQNGDDTISEVPEDRWNMASVYNADPSINRKSYCRHGGFLSSVNIFDNSFFGISPREAQAMNPEHHLMLELCWEAFERAGYTTQRLDRSVTGVFVGVSNNGATRDNIPMDLQGHSITGSAEATLSGRLSYTFNLRGPNLTVDTACSSSLVATHLACNALRQGECDTALVAGISLLLSPDIHIEFSKLRALSVDGRCRAFSDDTDGTGFSEGAVALVLKRLSDAKRDGDTIHAVLRGSAVQHGGRAVSLTAPNGPAQTSLIRTALRISQLEPNDIDYVEAHGTATKLGDPIEAAALAEVFGVARDRTGPMMLGSVKSNIGHTQAAAGLAGLLKVVLSMQKSMLPKSLHVSKPTEAIDWDKTNLRLCLESQPWLYSPDRTRRAGVSAFGLGGTIAHVIVEEYPGTVPTKSEDRVESEGLSSYSFLLSGKGASSLKGQADKLRLYMESDIGRTQRLVDVAFSLAVHRTHFQSRTVITAAGRQSLIDQLESISSVAADLQDGSLEEDAKITMLFIGQGSQRIGAGRQLYDTLPVFRESMDEVAAGFLDLEYPILDVLFAAPGSHKAALIDQTNYAQPALFAIQVSLWRLWSSWGVRATFLLGHSGGECAAAHVSGILNLSDACRLVSARGQLMHSVTKKGLMMAVQCGGSEVEASIRKLNLTRNIQVAGYNAPSQTVLSGDVAAVRSMQSHLESRGIQTKILNASHAFHSHHMDDILSRFEAVAQTMQFFPPTIPIISSMTGNIAAKGELERADYWVRQARNAVRLTDAFQTIHEEGGNVFLELGPDSTLCALGAACLADVQHAKSALWLASLGKKSQEVSVVFQSASKLHIRNVFVDWDACYAPMNCKRVALPAYAFQRRGLHSPQPHHSLPESSSSIVERRPVPKHKNEMMFELNWRPVNIGKTASCKKWGILYPADETEWTEQVKQSMLETGIQLVPITKLQDAKKLDGVFSIWHSFDNVIDMAHRFTPSALSQLQEVIQIELSVPIVWITHHAIGTGRGDMPVNVGAAPLLGLMRSARSEHPDLRLGFVDVDDPRFLSTVLSGLVQYSASDIAIRQGRMLEPHLERCSPGLPSAKRITSRKGGAVLITGALGNIGSQVAERLVLSRGVDDLILLSRRGAEAPMAKKLISKLADLGAKATVIAGDVSDLRSLESIFEMFTTDRPLRGIVHAAGVVDSGTILALSTEQCLSTLKPKVDGLWNLHRLTADMDLDFFAMFSSLSNVIGLPGLANYSAANSFVDMLSYLRRAQGLTATSLAYGPWNGEGMLATLIPTTRSHLSQFGMDLIEPKDGLDLFEQALDTGMTLSIPAVLDVKRMKNYFESQGGIPAFLGSLIGQSATAESILKDANLRNRLLEALPESRSEIMLRTVQTTVAKALGHTNIADLDVTRSLRDSGVDSLSAVLIRNNLVKLTSLTLPPNLTLLYPHVKSLSHYLLGKMMEKATKPIAIDPAVPHIDIGSLKRGILDPKIQFRTMENEQMGFPRKPTVVFVTGSTGFVGAFMVNEFLRRSMSVRCLIRADSFDEAQERMISVLMQYGLWVPKYAKLLQALPGDLSKPLFGLTEAAFNTCANEVDCILHSGALVDWMRPLEDYIGPNLVGTHEVLRLASRGLPKTIHFISTISTLPIHLGHGLSENDKEYGYGTSKYIAENLVAAARFRGASASSYRLPFVAASFEKGKYRKDRGDFLNNVVMGSLELGAFPSIDADLTSVLPVDYLSNTIATIMETDRQLIGKDYGFVNSQAPTFNQFFQALGNASGGTPLISFDEWQVQALRYAVKNPRSCIAHVVPIIDGYTSKTSGGLMKVNPVNGDMLGASTYPSPLLDDAYCRRYIQCITKSLRSLAETD